MSSDEDARLGQLVAEIRAEFPGFRVIRKCDSRLQRWIHRGLVAVTCGAMRDYLEGYHTTLGQRVYVTSGWEDMTADSRYLILRHERVHMRQFRRWSWPGMAVAYLLVPLPMGLAYCRARLEWSAYAESIRAAAELYGVDHVRSGHFRERIVSQFTGSAYGWMWPFPRRVERWYDRVVREIA